MKNLSGPLLKSLRALMNRAGVSAYLIPACDAHHSEYLAERDKRRIFVSGFTGSAGTAIVTLDKALMWTDGRYHLQVNKTIFWGALEIVLIPFGWQIFKVSEFWSRRKKNI